MQLIRFFAGVWGVYAVSSLASPSADILESCRKMKVVSQGVQVEDVVSGFAKKAAAGCENQLEAKVDGKIYGYSTCNSQQYLIVSNKFFLASQAINHSIDKNIVPGNTFSGSSTTLLNVKKGSESYLCIISPIFDSGKWNNYLTFYLIKHGQSSITPEVDFYFIDKIDWDK
ncbi:hypothetical protein [Chromobacterium rhizoryzae]|uniref:hypothetical protein n=1 Tax=Chromobacterium rhizoryzae TaxID=1778675 RepID=UPI001D097D97|nr:hypothetical protein [Chromobacterium rhizoryzae]